MKQPTTTFFFICRFVWRQIIAFFFLFMSSMPFNLPAQNPVRGIKFEHLGTAQGLSQVNVICILQDRQGFMWFGTQDGLNKYDGYSFTIYKHEALDSNSLSESSVTAIYEDRAGTLWIGTQRGGLNRFNRDTEQFTHFVHDPKNPQSLSSNDVRSIFEDRLGALWVGTLDAGLNKFDHQQKSFSRFVHDSKNPNSLSHNAVLTIYEDHAGDLWFGTQGGGLNRLERHSNQFTHFVNDPQNLHSLSNNKVHVIYEDHLGTLWIGTEDGGLNRFDRDRQQFTCFVHDAQNPHSLSDNFVFSICEDYTGTLWIGTWAGGLNKYNREKGQFTHFVNDLNNPYSLGSNTVYSIYEDRSGTLWFGMEIVGLARLSRDSRTKAQFNHICKDPENSNTLSNNSVRSIYEDRHGTLWIGTDGGGLNMFDREKEQFTHFVHEPENPHSLSENTVRAIFEDSSGKLWIGTVEAGSNSLWIGTRQGGLSRMDRDTRGHYQFTHFFHDPQNPNSLSVNYVRSILEDHTGSLWIGTIDGLNKFDRERQQFTRFVHDPNNPNSLSTNIVYTIHEDKTGTLWIGTAYGINRFDPETNQFTHFINYPNNPHSLSHNNVMSIHEDRTGILWIGTINGLNKFDRETQHFTQYYEKDGLPNNTIYGILEDDHGRLWMTTNRGLSRFDPKTKSFRNYDVNDGLQGNEFYGGAYFKNGRGEMFFGGINGFNVFHPDSIKDNPYIPPVVITALKRYNTDETEGIPIAIKGISQKQEIELSYKDNILAFEFAALNYNKTFKNQYAYQLAGYSDKWIQLGTERHVNFTNLDPGTYALHVKGSNNDGVWNETGTSLKIIITPPWWKTWWAYALYAISALGLLFAGRRYELARARLRYQLQLEKEQAERFAEVDHMKSRFFANISHEFRTPLTLILGPLESLLENIVPGKLKEQYEIMLRNGRRLLQLINQLLDLAKLEAGSMTLRAKPENIINLLKLIIASFQSLAERKRIALRFYAPEDSVSLNGLDIPPVYLDRDKFEKIISNLLSNAIKFTPESGEISVQLSVISNQLQDNQLMPGHWTLLTVKDTGIGIPANEMDKIFDRFYQIENHRQHHTQGTGIGLALTKELVQLHGGEIHVQSEVGKGSTFVVRLPLGKDHLKPEDIVETGDQLSVTSEQFSIDRSEQQQVTGDQRPATSMERPATSDQSKQSGDPDFSGQPVLLIVEDNLDMRAYLRDILSKSYRLIEAGDGEEGLRQASAAVPDLIISDVMMPKMDGSTFCRKVKMDETTSHIPVILLTARASGESRIEGLETGADDYLTKPFNANELHVRVKNLIEQRRRLRERFRRAIHLLPKHYKLLEMVGQGAMGVVYKARDLKLERFVALKFMSVHHSANAEEKKRFINEAKAASALDHPNICSIHEINETEDGQMFIVMAYYEGETLQKKIAGGRLSVAWTIEIAIQIAQGLARAHDHGIVHRDLKPANVMVTNNGVVKILDFGLAKLVGQPRLTKTGSTLGTLAYMPPEQTRGEEVNHRADIWALGVVLYEMLTGQLPFTGEYEHAVMYAVLNEHPKPVTSLCPDIPKELERVVNNCLEKQATRRYQHVDDLLADLKMVMKASGGRNPA